MAVMLALNTAVVRFVHRMLPCLRRDLLTLHLTKGY